MTTPDPAANVACSCPSGYEAECVFPPGTCPRKAAPVAGTDVPHPSEFLQEELDARGWDNADLAIRMGGDPAINLLASDMYRLVGPNDPRMLLGAEMSAQLSKAFGVSAEFFLNLHAAWARCHVH